MMMIIQVLMGAGTALIYGFFYPRVTPAIAGYIATGTPVLALIPLGFRVLPFYNMAVVIRAGLLPGLNTGVTRSYLVLLA